MARILTIFEERYNMATMKTPSELEDLAQMLYALGDKHWDDPACSNPLSCDIAICLLCGEITYACQPDWAARQCQCDTNV